MYQSMEIECAATQDQSDEDEKSYYESLEILRSVIATELGSVKVSMVSSPVY